MAAKDAEYRLFYWPGVPGRGESIRLALEAAGASYSSAEPNEIVAVMSGSEPEDGINPPPFAPPFLRHGDVILSQTANILLYLGPRLGLAPGAAGSAESYRINALAMTALDGLSDEVHNVHHPISTVLYYEDQKEEAKKAAALYVKERIPKYLGYFERVLQGKASGDGPWLHAGKMSFADLVLFQCVDGVTHMFPKAMAKAKKDAKYAKVFALYDAVGEVPNIKAYLGSERRQKYGMGLYRYYPELDLEG